MMHAETATLSAESACHETIALPFCLFRTTAFHWCRSLLRAFLKPPRVLRQCRSYLQRCRSRSVVPAVPVVAGSLVQADTCTRGCGAEATGSQRVFFPSGGPDCRNWYSLVHGDTLFGGNSRFTCVVLVFGNNSKQPFPPVSHSLSLCSVCLQQTLHHSSAHTHSGWRNNSRFIIQYQI